MHKKEPKKMNYKIIKATSNYEICKTMCHDTSTLLLFWKGKLQSFEISCV